MTQYTIKNFNSDKKAYATNTTKRIALLKSMVIFATQQSLQGQHTPLTQLQDILTQYDKKAVTLFLDMVACVKIKCKKSKKDNPILQAVVCNEDLTEKDAMDLLIVADWDSIFDLIAPKSKPIFTTEKALASLSAFISKCNKNNINFDDILKAYRKKK